MNIKETKRILICNVGNQFQKALFYIDPGHIDYATEFSNLLEATRWLERNGFVEDGPEIDEPTGQRCGTWYKRKDADDAN